MKLKRYFTSFPVLVLAFLLTPGFARAQFGGGTQIVFDPNMFEIGRASCRERV